MEGSLNAISPIDGRYHKSTEKLAAYFSEAAIIRYRVLVEVEYFIALCKLPLPQLKEIDRRYSQSCRRYIRISAKLMPPGSKRSKR